MCPHMAGLLARYERSPYGRRGRHDGFLSFALAVSRAASLGHVGAGGALAAGVRVYVRLKPEAPDRARADALRDKLTGAGVVVEDSPSGARWHLA